ncbi:hypothetical protein PL9214640190 [Planktothrix tepida PCC 9214]|uniref:Uncharacterized protein n=1 Tax=Planktothrix tepida PCC 9214 TaxID=671072 RepID=A0A1J1LP44_9CYAN|nr:hypothetical protein PL9214640190 [Planktothrix tepida PCC 9214]
MSKNDPLMSLPSPHRLGKSRYGEHYRSLGRALQEHRNMRLCQYESRQEAKEITVNLKPNLYPVPWKFISEVYPKSPLKSTKL